MKKELPANTELSHYRIISQIGAGTSHAISCTSVLDNFATIPHDWKMTNAWPHRQLSRHDGS